MPQTLESMVGTNFRKYGWNILSTNKYARKQISCHIIAKHQKREISYI